MARTDIVISANPVLDYETFELTLDPSRYLNPKTTHRDMTRYYQASFDLVVNSREEALEFLNNGLMREVRFYNDKAQVDWVGFINTIELDTGTAKIQSSLNDMSNSVWVRHTPVGGGAVVRSAVFDHAVSQGRFGTKEQVIGGGEISAAIADQIAENTLDLVFWPSPQLKTINLGGSLLEEPRVTCKCFGYWKTLMWQVYNQTINVGEIAAASVIQDIVTTSGPFINNSFLSANASLITREYDADRRAWDIISSICDIGNVSGDIFIAYFDENRNFIYNVAAPPTRAGA